VKQPCQYESSRANESSADGAYCCDSEFVRGRAPVGCEAGNGGGAEASLLSQQLGSDDEVAELLEEAFVVGATNARVDGFLCHVSKHPYGAVGAAAVIPNRPCVCGRWSHGGRGCAAVVAACLVSVIAVSKAPGVRSCSRERRTARGMVMCLVTQCLDLRPQLVSISHSIVIVPRAHLGVSAQEASRRI
jgi:hypothetical protein